MADFNAVVGHERIIKSLRESIKNNMISHAYIFCGNKGRIYTQIGNAVPSKLAEVVANATIQYLKEYQ